MKQRTKEALAPRRLLDYGVFFAVATALNYGSASLGSLLHRWSHVDGWSQNVLTWAVELALVLAVAEIWHQIDGRLFGPWSRSGRTIGISLFSGFGEPARYWAACAIAGVSLAAGILTGSSFVFLMTVFGMALLVDIVSLSVAYYHRRTGVAG
jgi:hypothetical protein